MGRGRHSLAVSSRPGIGLSRGKLRTSVVVGALLGVVAFAAIAIAADDANVEVADRYGYADFTLDDGTIIEYIGDLNTSYGSAGTGTFNSFVRLQGNDKKTDTQSGYNTDGSREFDTKAGTWTHSILLSEIPTIEVGGELYYEFWSDINDSDNTPKISLDDFELYLTDEANLTGYPFTGEADLIYDYTAANGGYYILINDVNQGSGRGDLRYLVPVNGSATPDCNYGNPACDTYLVLYSVWGGKGGDYLFDGGFEEWKVKRYPILDVSKDISGSYETPVDWTITKDFDDEYDLLVGETVTHGYEVSVDPILGGPENAQVFGTITIVGDEDTAVNAAIVDLFNETPANITGCSVEAVEGLYPIAAGATVTCSYELNLDAPQDGTNVARATFTVDGVKLAFQGTDSILAADFAETYTGFPDIDVTDTNPEGGPWSTTDATADTWNYTKDFTCPNDVTYEDGLYTFTNVNTAAITQTGASDIATVTVRCYAPVVSKTATPAWEEFYDWTITKNVDKTSFSGFAGDDWSFDYDVDVTLSTFDERNFSASGTITVVNPHPDDPMTVGLSDAVNGFTGVISADADCDYTGGMLTIPKDSSATCDYTVDMGDDLDGQQSTTFTNTATATLGGGSFAGTDDFTFGDVDPTLADGSEPAEVSATDDDATPGDTGDDHTSGPITGTATDVITYSQTGTCPTTQTSYSSGVYTDGWTNTAVIDQTDDSDSKTVTVTCYAPVVSKTADTYYTRSFDWGITKSADQTTFEVAYGSSVTINYTVSVFLEGSTDDGWGVKGEIYIDNPNKDADMTLTSVSDSVGAIAAVVDCPSMTVPADGRLTCTYDTGAQSSPDVNPFGNTNTATAVFAGADWTGTASVTFGDPTEWVDEAVDVTDTFAGFLGTVSYDDPPPATFTYARTVVGSELECGENVIDNTATFTAVEDDNDTGQTDSADESVTIIVICGDSRLTPTNTECVNFAFDRDNPDYNLDALYYQGDTVITNVTPGAMFYWIEVNHTTGGPLEVVVTQMTDFSKEVQSLDVKLFDGECTRVRDVSFSIPDGDATLTAELPSGVYYMQVRYDPKSLQGEAVPGSGTETFSFGATINGSSVIGDSLTLVPKGAVVATASDGAATAGEAASWVLALSALVAGLYASATRKGRYAKKDLIIDQE